MKSHSDPRSFLIPFGKHRGKPLWQIPRQYLDCVARDYSLWSPQPETKRQVLLFLKDEQLRIDQEITSARQSR